MEGDSITIVFIDARSSNNRASQISADIFDGNIRDAKVGFGSDIENIGMVFLDVIFDFAKGWADGCSHHFEKDFTKSIAKESIVKVFNRSPGSDITGTTFRNKGVDMRIPLKVTSESMKNTDKTGSKIFSFIHVVKHTKDNVSNRGK